MSKLNYDLSIDAITAVGKENKMSILKYYFSLARKDNKSPIALKGPFKTIKQTLGFR